MAGDDDGRIDDLLSFWFAPGTRERWFDPDPMLDRTLEARYGAWIGDAAEGRLDGWRATARGSLALVILLDQLPRNVWRGTPRAFAHDARAREVARAALAAGHDLALDRETRLFLYLPLEHSEDPADQERCVALVAALGDPEQLDHAVRHRDVVARFGRFPHRNAALGRASTPEETAFLREPGSAF